ncbi:unnamed protein product, partial [Owenia fusiformis]
GTYAGQNAGGIRFKARPFSALKSGLDSATLSYKVYFSPKFDFVKGGKLPGFYGGTGSCSGGRTHKCFSTRYMWLSHGDGLMYLYSPMSQASDFCKRKTVHCNFPYGHSIGRGTFKFKLGRWHTIQQYINFRKDSSTKINAIIFSTFFGG